MGDLRRLCLLLDVVRYVGEIRGLMLGCGLLFSFRIRGLKEELVRETALRYEL